MKTDLHRHFNDVEMPRWYRRLALMIRLLCVVALWVVLGWREPFRMTGLGDIRAFVVIGIAVVAMLPSIPKAYLEQRNRIRGLRDGSLLRHVEERTKRKD